MRLRLSFIAMLLSIAPVHPSAGSSVTVPDQYATIQGAIDSGADTVLVSYGNYPEALTVTNSVALIGLPTLAATATWNYLSQVTRIDAQHWAGSNFLLRGFRFTGSAKITGSGQQYVEDCRFDSSLTCSNWGSGHLWNSTVFGTVTLGFMHGDVAMNTIVGGGFETYTDGSKSIHDNVVFGPATIGIRVGEDCSVTNNYVRDCVVGISAPLNMGNWVSANVVEDCSGSGYLVGGGGSTVSNNIARRCGGRGVDMAGVSINATGNLVEDVGLEGIFAGGTGGTVADNTVTRAGGVGISIGNLKEHVTGNRVIASRSDGIVVTYGQEVRGNVVGRSAGRGLVIGASGTPLSIKSNTVYLNTGAGLEVAGNAVVDSITGNLAHGNSVGLKWTGSGTPFLGCNDWYGNMGGAVTGTSPGATDVALSPLFCDLPNDNVYLSAVSILVDLPGCGQVGALGMGCSYPVAVQDRPGEATRTLQVVPQPGRGAFRILLPSVTQAGQIEIFDPTGALRWRSAVEAGSSSLQWDGRDIGGGLVAPGVYFARLSAGAERNQARIVVVR